MKQIIPGVLPDLLTTFAMTLASRAIPLCPANGCLSYFSTPGCPFPRLTLRRCVRISTYIKFTTDPEL